jgi:hypothetical protein
MSEIQQAIDDAKREVEKAMGYPDYDTIMIERSVAFADKVLKNLIAHTINKNVADLFDDIIEPSSILLDDGKSKYRMYLDIVSSDYMLDLLHFKGDKNVIDRMVFLLDTVKILYPPIKEHMCKWAFNNDTVFNYVLQIGHNTTLFIDKDSEKRIGIMLDKVD